jgi:hypothetical protein
VGIVLLKLRKLMSDENPVNDSEELVDELGTTENETQEEETEELEVEGEGNAELEPNDINKTEEPSDVIVEKQGDISKGAQKRIDKLTRIKHESQARIKNLESQLEQNKKFLDAPLPENLDDLPQHEQVQHHTNRAVAQNNVANIEAQRHQELAQHKAQVWGDKVEARLEYLPDYQKVINSTGQSFKLTEKTTSELMDFIDSSDVGVDLAYYLGKNPQEANDLEGLSPRAMDRKLMRLEDKLEAQIKQPTKLSKAKAPISKKGGAVPKQKLSSNTRDFWKNVGAKG